MVTGKAIPHASIYLFNNDQRILIADSRRLQNQYLFLTPEMCQKLYNEAVAEIRLTERNATATIDVDEILAQVAKQHEQKFAKDAVRVDLVFPQQDMYKMETTKFAAIALANDKLLRRYHEEKAQLKQLIWKFSSTKGRTPEESVLAAAMSLSHARLVSGHASAPGNHNHFHEWLCSLFEPEDLSALVRYCSRPELSLNRPLEQALYLLVHNCPSYPEVYIPV